MTAQSCFCRRTAPTLDIRAWASRDSRDGIDPAPTPKNLYDGPQQAQTVHLYLDDICQDHHLLRVWMTPSEAVALANQLLRMAAVVPEPRK